jgi:hypothetical protein
VFGFFFLSESKQKIAETQQDEQQHNEQQHNEQQHNEQHNEQRENHQYQKGLVSYNINYF